MCIRDRNRAVYFYKIIGFVKNSDAFIFDEPQLIADSIDDFFNNLVALDVYKRQPITSARAASAFSLPSNFSVERTVNSVPSFAVESFSRK